MDDKNRLKNKKKLNFIEINPEFTSFFCFEIIQSKKEKQTKMRKSES